MFIVFLNLFNLKNYLAFFKLSRLFKSMYTNNSIAKLANIFPPKESFIDSKIIERPIPNSEILNIFFII